MFYNEQTKNGYFIWNDKTKGKYGPFASIYSKNTWYGTDEFDVKKYPGYKYSLGYTAKRIFILDTDGNIEIQNII